MSLLEGWPHFRGPDFTVVVVVVVVVVTSEFDLQKAGIRGPFLVIAPLSTIANWEREFSAWTELNVVVYHGSAYSRRLIHEYELYYRNEGRVISEAFKFNVIVTTYEVMLCKC